jgi:hypothetical protein
LATLTGVPAEVIAIDGKTLRRSYNRPEFKREYDIAVQLRADGLLEETIAIIDDKKEIVTETTTRANRVRCLQPAGFLGR